MQQQFEVELNRCAAMLQAADNAYEKHEYETAETLYHACLASLELIYVGDSVKIAECLTGLGDSYYFQDKFGSALPMYERVAKMRERLAESTPASIIQTHFKLAKTHENLKNPDQALEHYKKAQSLAQQKLVTGHPLGTTLLEAYAAFLKKTDPSSGVYRDIESRARSNRERYLEPTKLSVKILEGLAEVRDGHLVVVDDSAKRQNLQPTRHSAFTEAMIRLVNRLKHHPRLTLLLLTSPVLAGFLAVAAVAAYHIIGGESVQKQLVSAGQCYHTIDGHVRVSVLPDRRIKVENGIESSQGRYSTISDPWNGLIVTYLRPATGAKWFQKLANRLVDEDGLTTYLAPDQGTDIVFQAMGQVADSIHTRWSKGPIMDGQGHVIFEDLTYINPLNGKETNLPIQLAQWKPKADIALLERELSADGPSALSYSKAVMPGAVTGAFRGSPVAAVVAFGVQEQPSAVYVFGKNRTTGQWAETCDERRILMLRCVSGVPFTSNCHGSPTILLNGNAVISTTTPDRVRSLCKGVELDLLFLPVILAFGLVFRDQIRKLFELTLVDMDDFNEHIGAVLYLGIALCYGLYTVGVLCALFAGFM